MTQECVVFVANRGYALTSSRLSLIRQFLDNDWRVVVATADDEDSGVLVELGAELEPVVFNRGGLAPIVDCQAYRRLRAVYRRWRPSLIQHFHAKPIILGTLAARRTLGDTVRIANTVTGLGHAFMVGGFTGRLASWGYSAGMPQTDVAIFQNQDDQRLFRERNWVHNGQARLIAGSGVDLQRFPLIHRSRNGERAPVVLMLGRLLRQKGIKILAEVATRIHRQRPEVRFLLAGEAEPDHPDGVTPAWLAKHSDVEYLGRLSDVREVLAEADLFLFPSYYREGVPRVILEAAASGLPTVAFDVPGVREAVRDGETGLLVPDRDVGALTACVSTLLADEPRRHAMGQAARRMVEDEFDVRAIESRYLEVYRELGATI